MSKPTSAEMYSATSGEPGSYEILRLHANWSKGIVTIVALSMAVLIVAIIAVCMGMA